MTGNDLLYKMELIDPAFIEEADQKSTFKIALWIKIAAAAACLTLVVYIGMNFFPRDVLKNGVVSPIPSVLNDIPQTPSTLPLLTITQHTDGMGYEGYFAPDFSEIVDANPWNAGLQLDTLPVYRNPITYENGFSVSSGVDMKKMKAFLLDIAGRFGLNTKELKITDNLSTVDSYSDRECKVEAKGLTIQVDHHMVAHIMFDPAISLPKEYNFTYHDSSYADMVSVAEYLRTEYEEVLDMENAQTNISGGNYNIDHRQNYSVSFFDAGESITEQIINYNFNYVQFGCDDDGKLSMIRIHEPNLSLKVGDYPIIDSEQALELLKTGHYITTVPYEMPGVEYVKKVELIYHTGQYEEYHMPYYRFYVELPESYNRDGFLKDYGAYYVPAVESSYLSNMSVWNGFFQ